MDIGLLWLEFCLVKGTWGPEKALPTSLLLCCENLRPGDLTEIFHIDYDHGAIYVGNGCDPSGSSKAGCVESHVTLTGKASEGEYPGARSSSISVLSSGAVVKRELLKDVVGDCYYRVNNSLDKKYIPLPVNMIIYSAKEKIGEEVEYNILYRNFEHFVTDLKYGKAKSRQVRPSLGQSLSLVENVLIGGGVALGFGILGVVGYWLWKKRSPNQREPAGATDSWVEAAVEASRDGPPQPSVCRPSRFGDLQLSLTFPSSLAEERANCTN
ncbi:hypothetical protein MC885_006703 [Smutsia gigantea]|nr:hypothetical protein MC885_006703 [Smutsia gigantea]